jgi:uncharacterized protein YlxW (UPF0749 family)
MNLVGKILTVLIFVMSLVFASFAVAVYATHKNWYLEITRPETGLKAVLDRTKARNEQLTNDRNDLDEKIKLLQTAKDKAVKDLEEERDQLKTKYDQERATLADLRTQIDDALARVKIAEASRLKADTELATLRVELEKTQQAHDIQLANVGKLTDDAHNLANEINRLQAINDSLTGELAKAESVLRFWNKSKDDDISGIPPDVDGLVRAVTGEGRYRNVEISIGADDGLHIGHQLVVYRGDADPRIVGKIEVVEARPDVSVCKILPEYLQSPIQANDRVKARFNP